MSINYSLRENRLTGNPEAYTARVQARGSVDLETVIEAMVEQGSTITKADILGVLEDYFSAIERLVLLGYTVLTPSANYGTSIKGLFDGPDDSFDESRHRVAGAVRPGARFRRTVVERASFNKIITDVPKPIVQAFTDFESGERNNTLTPGGLAEVYGNRLKFDPGAPDQGIYLIGTDGSETRVSVVARNQPGSLIFRAPDGLADGVYNLQVRATQGSEEIRPGTLKDILTVGPPISP
ncbi:MAG: DUF4469 domain-containing protein [Anaerolineales bacterium]|nr:DUF4469 domain-containing protein [Anaerolineales bacterium]